MKIDARDVNGTRFSVDLSDLPARIFQHEFDHLRVRFSPSIVKAFLFYENELVLLTFDLSSIYSEC